MSVDNLGQILALGTNPSVNPNGERYRLLTPSDLAPPGDPAYPTIVPGPSSLAIYGVIATGLALQFGRPRARRAEPIG